MTTRGTFVALFIILVSIFLPSGKACTFYISNKCPCPIWPATAPNTGHPVIANGGFHLPPNKTRKVHAPGDWSGRIWARTGCNFDSTIHNPACETGDCDGKLECNGAIGLPPVTLVEVTLQYDNQKPSFTMLASSTATICRPRVQNKYGSPAKCKPSVYSRLFKDACPNYVSYAFETPLPLVACDSDEYVITFCPNRWGGDHTDI
ncbi:hypothetical protein BUALT_Bualt04G0151400 [Buddleja alternifolia]|uniref:Thaumatin-like protein n=1 Tax=Buddleja alternifolia TaxID=168488 RepID=A0AAV6XTI3_9LAMI|nr:hypothetical protein BUALT_Bualt04G0151400 [Buddleja alternifolia]